MMFVTAAAVVTMQPQELHSSWYREYSAQPRDDASQLRDKRHKLLLLKQAINAYISRSKPQDHNTFHAPVEQALHIRRSCLDQRCSDAAPPRTADACDSHAVTLPLASNVPAQLEEQVLQQHQVAVVSQSPLQPQSQHQQHPALELAQQQPAIAIQDALPVSRSSHRDILSRLLGPAVPAAAVTAAPSDLGLRQDCWEQDRAPPHQGKQWQRKRNLKAAGQQQQQQQQQQALQIQQQQQQRHIPQQIGGRRRVLPQPPSKLAHAQFQQHAAQPKVSVQPHNEQQQDSSWQQLGQQVYDAQSQAAAPTGHNRSLAVPAATSSWLPVAATVQHLFSPRTAMHDPQADRTSCHNSSRPEEPQHRDPGTPASPLPAGRATTSADDRPLLLNKDDVGWIQQHAQQQQQQHAATPPAASTRHQQQQQHQMLPKPAGTAIPAADACTPAVCHMVPGTPYSEEPGAAAAAVDAAGQGCDPCLLFGSFVAESPAIAGTGKKGPGMAAAAAAEVTADTAQQLSNNDRVLLCSTVQQQQQAGSDKAAAEPPGPSTEHYVWQQQQQQQQQQRQQQWQHLGRPLGPDVHQVAAGACATMADRVGDPAVGGSNSIAVHPGQRVISVDVGLPVIKIITCQQQCVLIMQQQDSRSTGGCELMLLNLQQKQRSVCISVSCLAALLLPQNGSAPVTTLVANGAKLLPSCGGHMTSGISSSCSVQQQQRPAVLAVVAPLQLSTLTAAHQAGAADRDAAVTPPPPGSSAQQQRLSIRVKGSGFMTPDSSGSSINPSTGKKSLRALSSSGRKEHLLGRIAGAAAGCEVRQQHGVNLYCLNPGIRANQQQQQQGDVVLLQRLHTAAAVTCVAVSDSGKLLAAAGSGGCACVWKLLPATDQQQQQSGPVRQPVDVDSMTELPAAAYRGISFPHITDLSFVCQPGRSSSSSSSSDKARILLVGCCSQGSVAVWDVQQQQQIISVHKPDVNIYGLLPVQLQSNHNGRDLIAAATPSMMHKQQQQQQSDVLLMLALVATRSSSGSSKLPKGITPPAAGRLPAVLAPHQQQLALHPVLLQEPSTLVLGSTILENDFRQHQQQAGGGVLTAAASGSLAAAVVGGGSAQMWDVVSGSTLMCATLPPSALGSVGAQAVGSGVAPLSIGLVLVGDQQQQQQQQGSNLQHQHPQSRVGPQASDVVLMGSATGVLTLVLL